MVVDGKDKNYRTMFCKCGCGNGVVLKADSGHNNRRNTFKEKNQAYLVRYYW